MTLAEKFNNYCGNSHGFALSRTVSCRFSLRLSAYLGALCVKRYNAENPEGRRHLAADGDAESPDVAARVKGAQRDRVLARSK